MDPTRTQSLLRHVSETGASRPGCRHSLACLGGWQTPGLGYCQAQPAGVGSCGVRATAQTLGTHSEASGAGRGMCPLLSACTHPCPVNSHGRRFSLRSGAWVPPACQSCLTQGLCVSRCPQVCPMLRGGWGHSGSLRAEMTTFLLTESLLLLPTPHHMLKCRPKDSSLPHLLLERKMPPAPPQPACSSFSHFSMPKPGGQPVCGGPTLGPQEPCLC